MMELDEIIQTLPCRLISGAQTVAGVQVYSACVSDMLSEVMAHVPRGCLWITHQSNENIVAIAYFKELAAVLLANSGKLEAEVLEKAATKNIVILGTDESAYTVAGKLYAMGVRGHR
jgi:hypothetical protein